MRTLKFYGASDDLFEIEGGHKRGEPDEISPTRVVQVANKDGGLLVSAHYALGDKPCWTIGISQLDEDMPLPDWPMKFTTGAPSRGYSVVLNLDVPDDVIMKVVGDDDERD